ncbi:MATE family efflux transporter [Lactovum miscens]|uniref:Probable multidrug resistance protein NorM n=1 Tax=Lactovum miscens TaxID=190387 RepID=A0A841C7D6_9LACT|nr:MATE family efflux transporter [Lactovum miscens]MBB5888217.1 putative MATE family efflux protein [Lactovum miscens]
MATPNTNMLEGPLFKRMLVFSLPIMGMYILQLLFNTTDMVMVGRFSGSNALAAVGATGSLINLIIGLFMGLSVGITVTVAQDMGARKYKDVSETVHTSMVIGALAGIAVMIMGIAICRPILVAMGTPQNVIGLSETYMTIYFIAMPATMIYNFIAGILRAIGDSSTAMYFLLIAGVIHLIFNFIFVIGFHMSVAGVAIATVISEYIAAYLFIHKLLVAHDMIRLHLKKLRIHKDKMMEIIKIGLPAGMQSFLFSFSNVLIQSAVNSFGATMMAASAASSNVENYIGTPMTAYYNTAIAFTGQNFGAKKFDRIDRIAKICLLFIFATWILLGGFTLLFDKQIIGIFSTDNAVIKLGVLRLTVIIIAYFTNGVMNVFPGLTRAMGYSVSPMLATLIGACLFRIVWLLTIFTTVHTELILFICYPITWGLAGIFQLMIFFYARKKIRNNQREWVKTKLKTVS